MTNKLGKNIKQVGEELVFNFDSALVKSTEYFNGDELAARISG